jgi:hypothetical protein
MSGKVAGGKGEVGEGGGGRGGGVMMMSFVCLSGTKNFTDKQRESLVYWYSIQ